jgi:peptide/nickel transport system permease protein
MQRNFKYIFFTVFALILVAPFFAPHNPLLANLEKTLLSPGTQFWLGTDGNGRDIFSQVLYGARLSLGISSVVVLMCLTFGILAGYIAGFYGGIFDKVFLYIADVFQAFPGILLAIAVAAFIEPSVMNLIWLLSFVGWVSYARVVRAQILELKTREFIAAGQSIGVSSFRMLRCYVLPNIAAPLIIQASFGMAGVILAESTLSFLGLGLPANVPSLGKMLDHGVNLLLVAPHVSVFPGAVIMFFVLSFNLLGDKLRARFL